MFLKRLLPNKGVIPNLVIAQRVVDKMVLAANHYVEDETGEALIGLVVAGDNTNGVPTIYVLETIAPDESAVREEAVFKQGDERQDELIWWYHQNWNNQREKKHGIFGGGGIKPKWDVQLRHLGDWHRQPGFMIAPSGGDLMTALDMLDDSEMGFDFLLAPIVTLDHPATTSGGEGYVNYLTVPSGAGEYDLTRIDFWYITDKTRAFVPIIPTIYPNSQLPELVPPPWHLTQDERITAELTALKANNVFTSIISWDVDDKLPLEICFLVAQQGASHVLILVTQHDYPKTKPIAYRAPFIKLGDTEVIYDIFGRMLAEAKKVTDPQGWVWSEEKTLADYLLAIEADGKKDS
jgi:hypothetical protein